MAENESSASLTWEDRVVKEDFLEEVSRNCRRGTWIPRTVVVGRKEMAWCGLGRGSVGIKGCRWSEEVSLSVHFNLILYLLGSREAIDLGRLWAVWHLRPILP